MTDPESTCRTLHAPIHIISLGAGVQSSTMALMAARGLIAPMPQCAIFADTQAEPQSVYTWLDWLEPQLPFPVIRCTRGSLASEALRVRQSKKTGNFYTKHNIPAFMAMQPGKKDGLMKRHCTGDFKIDVIHRAIRARFGRKRSLKVIQWVGITTDEAHRMKPARKNYIENRWPLIEISMTRKDCLKWMKANEYPEPPRSSCVFCPFHNDAEWLRLKTTEPIEFARAVEWEKLYQVALDKSSEIDGKPWLHRSCIPLSEIDFKIEAAKPDAQLSLFGNECEGMCGV